MAAPLAHRISAFLLATSFVVGGAPATATDAPGGLSVAPVQLSLADARRSVSTTVTNPGADPITVQVRLYSWKMQGEEEVYEPAVDVGFSPPLFRLQGHAAQAVRVVAKTPPGAVERSYRLIIDQLPLADAPGQLQLPVRMVLPVFIEPAMGVGHPPQLQWSARHEASSGRVVVAVSNHGTVHARIVNLSADDGHGATPIAPGLSGYALAGQSRSWSYRAQAVPDKLTITAESGTTPIRVTIPVAR